MDYAGEKEDLVQLSRRKHPDFSVFVHIFQVLKTLPGKGLAVSWLLNR